MQVNVLIEHGEELPIEELCTFVMKKMNLPECTDVTVTFVSNERIHELNREYRGIDRPTDVLSFECDNVPFEDEVLDDVEEYELGDTIIATDVALAQTEEYGTTLEEEVTILTIHSLLHLCGYDHIEDDDYEIMHALEEKLMRAAIVQSLLRLDGVNAVSLSVDGEPLKNADGAVIGLMNEDDFVENTGSSLSSYQSGTLTLYFANKKGDKLVEQKMDVRYSSNVPKEKLIVEKLMQGPTGNGAYPTINPDTNLLSVTIKDHVCYVNFDSTFLTSVYDVLPEITIYSLVDSIIAGTEATQVQITINGETKAVYMEKIDLSQPLEKDMDWVAVNDDE